MAEREEWDIRYEEAGLIHGREPSEFLRENGALLPGAGLALDIAGGEGRNSIFLAKIGLEPIVLDISVRALGKCLRFASERGVRIEVAAVDLKEFRIPEESFDLIINFNYLQRDLCPGITEGLKRGGIVIFETLTTKHLRWNPDFNTEFLLEPGELRGLFRGLEIVSYREADLPARNGYRSVASLIGRKA